MYVEVLTKQRSSSVINIEVTKDPLFRPMYNTELIERIGLFAYNQIYKETSLYFKGDVHKNTIYLISRKDKIYSAVSNPKDINGAINMMRYHLYDDRLIFEIRKYKLVEGVYRLQ